jgi:hypothetical protein
VTFQTTRAGYDIEMDIEPDTRSSGYGCVLLSAALSCSTCISGACAASESSASMVASCYVDFPDDSPASTLWLRMKPDVTLF